MTEWSASLAEQNWASGEREKAPAWDEALAEERLATEARSRLDDAARQAHPMQPDTAARAGVLARKEGLPVGAVLADMPEFEAKALAETFWSSPQTVRAFLADPHNAAVAKDDVGPLGALESAWGKVAAKLGAEYDAGIATNKMGFAGSEAAAFGLTPDRHARIEALRAEISKADDAATGNWFVNHIAGPAARMIGQQIEGLPRRGAAAMTGAGAALLAGQLGPQVAAPEELVTVPAAAMAGFMAQSAAESGLIEAGNAWLELNDVRGPNGERLDPGARDGAAAAVGLVNGALEMVGLHIVAKPMAIAAKKLFTKGVVEYAASDVGSHALTAFARDYAGAIAGETGTEVLQEITNIAAEELAKMGSDGTFARLDDPSERARAIDRIVDVATQTAGAMTLLGLPGAGGNFIADRRAARQAARQAEADGAALTEAVTAVQSSKLAARDPETMRDLIRRIAGDDGTLHMPVEQLQALYQDGIITDDTLNDWGIADQVSEALATGGDVLIGADRFLTSRVAPEAFPQMIRHIRTSPGAWTPAEAAAHDPEQDRADLQERIAMATEGERAGQFVHNDTLEQLRASGQYSASQAEAQAQLVRDRYLTRAARMGGAVDADTLYAEDRVSIRGPSVPVATPDMDLVIARLRSGNAEKTTRYPVLNVLKRVGGVKPGSKLAAELEAMGITAKSAPGLFRKGGITDGDNLVASEDAVFVDNAIPRDGNGYVDRAALLAAIGREWAGDPLTLTHERDAAARLDTPVAELRQAMDRAGFDYAKATNHEVKAWISKQQRETGTGLEQSALSDAIRKVRDVLSVAKQDKTSKAKEKLFPVPDWLSKLAAEKAGLDLRGYDVAVDAFAFRHIFKKHGDQKAEESRGQVAVTSVDMEAFPSVVANPDRVILGLKGSRGQDQVAFLKGLADGSTLVVTEGRTGQKELALESMRKYPPRASATAITASLTPNVRNDGGAGPIIVSRDEIVKAQGHVAGSFGSAGQHEVDGFRAVLGEVFKALDGLEAKASQAGQHGIAEGGKDLRSVGGTDAAGILAERYVTRMVELVFNAPVIARQGEEGDGRGLGTGQTGDAVNDFGGFLAPDPAGTRDAADLLQPRP